MTIPLSPKATRAILMLGAATLFFAAGCGGGADSRSAEDVARDAFAALKKGDGAAYQSLCITEEVMLATLDKAVASGQMDKEALDRAPLFREKIKKDFSLELEAGMKANFVKVARDADWSKLDIKSVDTKFEKERGLEWGRAKIELSDGRHLVVDGLIKSTVGWRIAETRPLDLRPADWGKTPPPDDFKREPDHVKDARTR